MAVKTFSKVVDALDGKKEFDEFVQEVFNFCSRYRKASGPNFYQSSVYVNIGSPNFDTIKTHHTAIVRYEPNSAKN